MSIKNRNFSFFLINSATSREIAGDSEAITLVELLPATQYTLYVSAYWNGQKYRSRSIIFRTLGNVEGFSLSIIYGEDFPLPIFTKPLQITRFCRKVRPNKTCLWTIIPADFFHHSIPIPKKVIIQAT
jgi:hypothetical protein